MTTRYKLRTTIHADIIFYADDGYPHEFVDEFSTELLSALHEVGIREPRLDISVSDAEGN